MRKIIVFIITLVSFVACDLTKIEPAQTKAFMKYFGDLGDATGVDLIKVGDGYLILGNSTENNTVFLIHVDENGNTLADPWTEQNFEGRSVITDGSSYFIVGDRINATDPTMRELGLLKVSTGLQAFTEVNLAIGSGDTTAHGAALVISSANEIVVSGYYQTSEADPNQTFLFGYNSDLAPTWTATRYFPSDAGALTEVTIPGSTLVENEDGDFVWTTLGTSGAGTKLRSVKVGRDEASPGAWTDLLLNYTVGNKMGDFSPTNTGAVSVQNILTPANEIALSTYSIQNPGTPITATIGITVNDTEYDLIPNAVIQDKNSSDFIVLAETTNNGDATRSDTDFYVSRVGADGIVSGVNGFTNIFGGTGNESGAAIIQADDGGYVLLGTMENTNGRSLVVLAKLNKDGELIN